MSLPLPHRHDIVTNDLTGAHRNRQECDGLTCEIHSGN
jgi:hypothetical protein